MKPALLWLFPEGWDDIAMRDAESLRGRYDVIFAGFDLFRFPENASILWFDARRFVERMARIARKRGAVGVVSTHEQYGALIAALVARRAGLPGPDPRAIALALLERPSPPRLGLPARVPRRRPGRSLRPTPMVEAG